MTDDEVTQSVRARVLEALAGHRRLTGGPASGALDDSVVLREIVSALDEERGLRETAAKAARRATAAAAESALVRWRDLLGELDRLDANALAQVCAHVGADVEARSRGRAADDDSWLVAMSIAAKAWWSAVETRPRAAGPLILEQLRRAMAALGGSK